MKTTGFTAFGSAPRIKETKIVAAYEKGTGRIVHMHTVTICEGGRTVSDKEAIDTALSEVKRIGYSAHDLEVKLSNNRDHACRPHGIDVSSGEFVALPLPQFMKKAEGA